MVTEVENIEDKVSYFLKALGKRYKVYTAYIYGSHSKGNATEWSDIDVAVVSPDFTENIFDIRLKLMKLAASIDDRIEPHPFHVKDFDSVNPLVNEIIKYGIQVSYYS